MSLRSDQSLRIQSAVLETLESRRLLSASIQNGVLVANATTGHDVIELKRSGTDNVVITIWSGSIYAGVAADLQHGQLHRHQPERRRRAGHDLLHGLGLREWCHHERWQRRRHFLRRPGRGIDQRGEGNDTLWGYGGADTLLGGDDDDVIHIDSLDTADGNRGLDRLFLPGASPYFAKSENGALYVTGTSGDDNLSVFGVNENSGTVDALRVTLNGSTIELNIGIQSRVDVQNSGGKGLGDDTITVGDNRTIQNNGWYLNFVVFGGEGNDHFYVSSGGIANLYGGAGDDVAEGLGDAIVDFGSGGSGIDTIIAADQTVNMPSDVENADVSGNSTVNGNDLNNIITFHGNGVVNAGEGNDTIYAYEPDGVTLNGEGGNDKFIIPVRVESHFVIYGGDGNDTLVGGGSDDFVVYVEYAPPPSSVITNRQLVIGGTMEGDTIELLRVGFDDVRIRTFIGTTRTGSTVLVLDKTFDMDDFDSIAVLGLQGFDSLYVANGVLIPNLRMYGGYGSDTLLGSSGNDRLVGGANADNLAGIAGNDYFDVRDGERDTINGGSGTDTVFGDNIDRLTDIEVTDLA